MKNHTLESKFTVGENAYVVSAEYKGFDRWVITAKCDGKAVPIAAYRDEPVMRDVCMGDIHKAASWLKRAEGFVFASHVYNVAGGDA